MGQSVMLDKLEERIDDAAAIQTSLNQNVKDLLEESGRGMDKLCIDVTCILLMIGFISGMLQISNLKQAEEKKETNSHYSNNNNSNNSNNSNNNSNSNTAQTRHYLRRNSQ